MSVGCIRVTAGRWATGPVYRRAPDSWAALETRSWGYNSAVNSSTDKPALRIRDRRRPRPNSGSRGTVSTTGCCGLVSVT
jgi:hypothetical protein